MFKLNDWNENTNFSSSKIAQNYFKSIESNVVASACGSEVGTACGSEVVVSACGSEVGTACGSEIYK